MNDIQISIKDLVYKLLLSWRKMLACGLVLAIIAGILAFAVLPLFSSEEESDALDFVIEDGDSLTQLDLLNNSVVDTKALLSENKKLAVDIAFESYKTYVEQAQEIQKYLNSSIKMKLNASAVPTVTIQYLVDTHYQTEYPVISSKDFTKDIISSFNAKLLSTKSVNNISNELGWDVDSAYVRELISIYDTADDILTIRIFAPDEESATAMSAVIQNSVKSELPGIEKIYGNFDVTFIHEQYTEMYVESIFTTKQGYISNLNSINNDINNLDKNLDKNSKAYYNALLAQYLYNEEIEQNDGISSSLVEVEEPVAASKLNPVLLVIIAFVAGIFIVAFVELFKYIFTPVIRIPEDVREVFDIKLLGSVNGTHKKKALSFVDKSIEKAFYSRRDRYSSEEKLKMIVSGSIISAKKSEISSLYLTGTELNEDTDKVMSAIGSKLNENNVKTSNGRSVLFDPESLEKMVNSDAVILVERAGVSRYDEIKQELDLCRDNNVNVLGVVVIC